MSGNTWKLAASAALVAAALGAHPASAAMSIEVLSSMPQMVTGGDALVKITGAAAAPTVTVGGKDVSAAFKGDAKTGWVGLVSGLKDGDNALSAKAGSDTASVTLVNHGLNDTLFAGPQQDPFLCENYRGVKADQANKCAADTVVKYVYLSKADNKWKAFDPKGARPDDIADTAVGANRVPVIVRQESGIINRSGYTLAMLHDPAAGGLPTPDNQTANKAWNGKLIYCFGGGVQAAFHTGVRDGMNTGGTGCSIMNDHMLLRGYALAGGSLNRFGGNNNDITSGETAAKVKEHFIEEFGPPKFTIGYGPSGGSMQQNLIGNTYPGLLDGTIPQRLYSDTITFLQPLYDCELLVNYFKKNPEGWTDSKMTAVSGMATFGYCTRNGARYPNARPDNCDAAVKDAIANEPSFKGKTVRCTYQDNLVNVFGKDPKTGFARNPFDNVGIQYGLNALNDGMISFDQFIDLNKKVGGHDINGKIVAARQVGDPIALKAAYAYGRMNEGNAGLNEIPILDIRTWHDVTNQTETPISNIDVHNAVHSKILRDRLVRSNGNADNMVTVTTVEVANKGEGSVIQVVELKYLEFLDMWLENIAADTRAIPKAEKVRQNRPVEMADACFPSEWMRVTDATQCEQLFPYAAHPRMAAGGPPTDDVMKCQLKPITAADYKVKPSAAQIQALKDTFPQGVCDYTKPGVGQVPLAGTWLMYEGDAEVKPLAKL